MSKEKKMIKLSDRVEVVATNKAMHMKAGETYLVHPVQAKRLKEKGWAVDPGKKPIVKTEKQPEA